ncbi:MAG TPA: XRE family transcriptional regulator, partial [Bacteroidetes bacterium]|nr:XRE family transcriptional regulator [Bacteroidota bacterium]
MDNPYQLETPEETARELAAKVRKVRLARKWKQSTLADRAGVSLASLRRFEQTGQISLKNLLLLAFALGRLDNFASLFQQSKAGS